MSIHNGKVVQTIENREIRDINEWITAFVNYALLYGERHPNEHPSLWVYLKIIRFAQANFEGYGWRTYDIRFRLAMANDPDKAWYTVNHDLWSLYVTRPTFKPREIPQKGRQPFQGASGGMRFRGQGAQGNNRGRISACGIA